MQEGKVVNINQKTLFSPASNIKETPPLVAVSGSCMNVGKTSVAANIIKNAVESNLVVNGVKLTGAACIKDTIKMSKCGAKKTASFLDAGLPSTAGKEKKVVSVAKGGLNYLSQNNPDLIVIELGNGLLGEYGALEILTDRQIKQNIKAHIGCAYDPLGAMKLSELSDNIGLNLDIISGPITDNSVGKDFIEQKLDLPAANVFFEDPQNLFNLIQIKC